MQDESRLEKKSGDNVNKDEPNVVNCDVEIQVKNKEWEKTGVKRTGVKRSHARRSLSSCIRMSTTSAEKWLTDKESKQLIKHKNATLN